MPGTIVGARVAYGSSRAAGLSQRPACLRAGIEVPPRREIGPRVMSELGTDRATFPQANAIQCYGGVVPRQQQSGDTWINRHRTSANHTLQHNLYLWAKASVVWAPWCRAFYCHEKKRGLWSADIYRRLAAKWTRIFWKCWIERKPYDEAQWLESLKKRGSWLYEATLKLMEKPLDPVEVACEPACQAAGR
ncbi:MAG: IS110 family transposase [Verrucomicrobia bacterium]|nr:IS110 family transposase [Verrucomicrobiota bacterium]